MTITVDCIDVSNFLSASARENVAGLGSVEVVVSGPYTSVTAITVGNAVTVAPEVVTGTGFTMSARCASCRISTNVEGAAEFEATFKSNGAVTLAV